MSHTTNHNGDNVCKFYNAFFKDGCVANQKCPYAHLNHHNFLRYVSCNQKKNFYPDLVRLFRSGMHQFHTKQYHLAANTFKSLCRINPFNAQNNLYYARILERIGSFKDSEYYYRKAISIQPRNATFYGRYAALLHLKMNRCEESRFFYEEALRIRDDINAVHCHFGKLLFDYYQNYKLAAYHFEKCLSIFPRDEECNFYYAQLLFKLKDYKSAEYYFEKALSLQNKPYVWHNFYYSLNCIKLRKYNLAKQQLQISLSLKNNKYLNNQWPSIHFEYGFMLYFIYNSCGIGLKHMLIAIKSNTANKRNYNGIYNLLKNNQNTIEKNEENYIKFRNFENVNNIKSLLIDKDICLASYYLSNMEISSSCSLSPSAFNINLSSDDDTTNSLSTSNDSNSNSNSSNSSSNLNFNIDLNEILIDEKDIEDIVNFTIENNGNSSLNKTNQLNNNIFHQFLLEINLEKFYNSFQKLYLNDICLIDKIDDRCLLEQILMTSHQIRRFREHVEKLRINAVLFINDLKCINDSFYKLYYQQLKKNGILTSKLFFFNFKRYEDLQCIIYNQNDAQIIWHSMMKIISKR